MNEIQRHDRIGGWLLLLCLLLTMWGPAQVALTISIAVAALPVRGPLLGVFIVVRILLASLGVAAGLAIYSRKPTAVALARLSLTATAVADLFRYHTTYYPSNRMPGDEWIETAITIVYTAAWLVYLARSKRVASTFDS